MKNLKYILLFSIIILFLTKKKIVEGSTNSDENTGGCRPKNTTAVSSVRTLCSGLNTETGCTSENECQWFIHSITTSDPDNTNEFSSDGSSSSHHTTTDSGVEGGITTTSSGISGEKDNTTDIMIVVSLTFFAFGLSGFLIYKYS